jgi:hypothetical protein
MLRELWNWDEFKREMVPAGDPNLARKIVYRGQASSDWNVTSSFDRDCPDRADRPAYYRKLLAFFAYQVRQYGEDLDDMAPSDRAAIAQHYGMPTRLIDWSTSPYVAAFMAFYSAVSERRMELGDRVAVWALDCTRFAELNAGLDAQFGIVKTRRLENDRVWRQGGLFIEAIGDCAALDDYLERRAGGGGSGLVKWTLPASEAAIALNDLIQMGLSPAALFPDRGGAAKYVRLRMAMDRLSEDRS